MASLRRWAVMARSAYTHLQKLNCVVDVAGWFEGDAFVGSTSQRLVDTRDGTGGQMGQLLENAPLTI